MSQDLRTTATENTSRRHILRSVAGILGVGISSGVGEAAQSISPSADSNNQSMDYQQSPPLHSQGKRLAYVTLPGFSGVALLANLPYLLNTSTGPQPIIFIDTYDYNRIRNWAQKSDDTWIRDGAVAYGQMLQRGAIQPVDYARFYPDHIQQQNLQRNQAVLEEIHDERQQRIAVDASEGSLKYNLGTYQKPLLAQLGEDLDDFSDSRRNEKKRQRKLDRGGGMPNAWNARVVNQYVTALTIRKNIDKNSNLNVKYILGEGETAIFEEFLHVAKTRNNIPSHLKRLEPGDHIIDLTREQFTPTRESLDVVGEIAAKMTGVQQNEWNMFAPTLATPQYNHLFHMPTIREEMRGEPDTDALIEEATSVVDAVERRTDTIPTSREISYAAEYVGDEIPASQLQDGDLRESFGYAAKLLQYSNELDSLIHEGGVSETAGLIAASVVSDPSRHNNEDTVFQQTENMIRRFNPPSLTEPQLMAYRRRKDAWEESPDWYLTTDRKR